MNRKPNTSIPTAQLRGRAEARLRARQRNQPSEVAGLISENDSRRLLHELQVHQVELEMQNSELRDARDRTEALLGKYTELYDFAPIGYFSLDEEGRILEVNLTGAAMLGVERSRLLNRRLARFVGRASQPIFGAFMERVFSGTGNQVCEAALARGAASTFWAGLHAAAAISAGGTPRWCRVAVSDISSLKQAEEAQRRVEVLAATNEELRREIVRRKTVEESLRKSEQDQRHLLEQSRKLHEELRHLSRRVLVVQEEERKRISRELHDVIAQTLTAINNRLAALKNEAVLNTEGLDRSIAHTQKLVEQAVNIVHQFARALRPAVLDDLGLLPALTTFMKQFRAETGIRVSLSGFSGVEEVDGDKRIVLYRVAQEAFTNIARHAQASRADVTIEKLDGAVRMTIKDDGKGFQEERLLRAKKGKRLGFLGMRERLEMVGGNFTVTSKPGEGTTVLAQVPLIDRTLGGTLSAAARTKPRFV